jgi:hypothetical protein
LEPNVVTFEAMVAVLQVTQRAEFNWPMAQVGSMGITTFHMHSWAKMSNLIGSSKSSLLWIKRLVWMRRAA